MCGGLCVCVCVCMHVRVRVYACARMLKTVSMSKILPFTNTLLLIWMSCQQHWVTSGQSNSLIQANVHFKMFLKSIHKTNLYTNIQQYVPCIHIHQTQTFQRVLRRRTRLSPELKQPTCGWDTHVHTLDSQDQYAPFSSESHQQNRSPSDVQIITKGVTDNTW